MKNILISGGCGFIGSNFVRYLLDKYDYKIFNIDKLTYAGNLNNLNDVKNNTNYHFIKGDICNSDLVDKILKKYSVNTIINFAAESHVDKSNQEGSFKEFERTNIFGTRVLLDKSVENKVDKFLQISTDEVYGSIEEGSFTEENELNPSNPYSKSKSDAEKITLSYSDKLFVLITRSSNNFGPYQYPEKFIPLIITNILDGKKIPVYGDGKQVRDWLYVEDNCDAIDFVLNRGKNNEIYNITTKNEYENIWMAKKILKIMNKDESFIQFVKDRPGHDRRYSIDNKKLLKLGWNSKLKFNDKLNETVNWYINNRKWWERIKNGEHFKEWYDSFYIKERGLK